MHNRNFSASAITQRRMEKAMAGSFFSATTREACPRVKDSSFLSSVRSGQMTQYSAYTGGCVGISPGCPCSELNQSVVSGGFVPAVPGAVSGIVYTVGSLIVSWNPPREGTGPFRYVITLYKKGANGSELVETVETAMTTSYRFTTVEEGAMYHATVCAKNDFGLGPVIAAEKNMVAPPSVLSVILNGCWSGRSLFMVYIPGSGSYARLSSLVSVGFLYGTSMELGHRRFLSYRCGRRMGLERSQVLSWPFRSV
jgi:hypothetical protein